MRVNIHKKQQGGLIGATYLIDSPSQKGMIPQQSQETEKSGVLEDDLIKALIKDGGLTNEVYSFIDELESSGSNPLDILDSKNSNRVLRMTGKIIELQNNKKKWETSNSYAKEAGTLNEIAVGSQGEIYVRDDSGKITGINASSFKENKDKYQPLSIAELLNARAEEKSLVFNDKIFDIANQSIGTETIIKNIKAIFETLGDYGYTSESHISKEDAKILKEQFKEFNGKVPTNEQLEQLKNLTNIINTPGEFYKIEQSEKRKGENINEAFNYIWATLGQNAKHKLAANALISGIETTPQNIIANMLTNYTSSVTSNKISPEKMSDFSDKESPQKPISNMEMFIQGKGQLGTILWNDPTLNPKEHGSNTKRTIISTGQMYLPDNKGDLMSSTILTNILSSPIGQYVESDKAYFGNKKISLDDMNDIIINNASPAQRVYLPVKEDGSPNWELSKEFDEVLTEIDKMKKQKISPKMINDFLKTRGMNNLSIDNNYQIRENSTIKPFLLMYGYIC